MKKTISILLILILLAGGLLVLTGCGEQVEETTEIIEKKGLLTIYTDSESEEYKKLGNEYARLGMQYEEDYGANIIKIVANKEDVNVKLQYGDWDYEIDYFNVYEEHFDLDLEKGEVYGFEGELAEGIVEYRLVIEYRGVKNVWYLVYDGKEGKTTFTIEENSYKAKELTADSNIMPICVSLALTSFMYGNDYEEFSVEEFCETIASSSTMMIPKDRWVGNRILIEEKELETIIKTMYPNPLEAPGYSDGDMVTYAPEGRYDYYYIKYWDINWMKYRVTDLKKDRTGTWEVTVEIKTDDGAMEEDRIETIYRTIYLEPNKVWDEESPFEYHIIGVSGTTAASYNEF